MGKIIDSYILPHPPIIIPEVGKGSEKGAAKTIEMTKRAAERIKKKKPSVIILVSPHAPLFEDYIYINDSRVLRGDLKRFGTDSVELGFKGNPSLVKKISKMASKEGFAVGGIRDSAGNNALTKLDHGALVPLYFVNQVYPEFSLVHISISTLTLEEHFLFGKCIGEAIEDSNERAVFVASADLSHRLREDGPYGYNKYAQKFDHLLIESIERNDIKRILEIDYAMRENAGECGLRSIVTMLGALDGQKVQTSVYSYEGPFGVGYMVARLKNIGDGYNPELCNSQNSFKHSDSYTGLAREALELYIKEGKIRDAEKGIPDKMRADRAGVFVSLKKEGRLRGCIGTIIPTRKNIAEEIIQNAISAGTKDPRFNSVRPYELGQLEYSVDLLGEPQPITSEKQLDVKRYGVIVKAGQRVGLLLPNLEGINTPREQVAAALQKAGIDSNEEYSMERFEVIRHE